MDSVLILNTNINVTTIEEVSSLLQKKESKLHLNVFLHCANRKNNKYIYFRPLRKSQK